MTVLAVASDRGHVDRQRRRADASLAADEREHLPGVRHGALATRRGRAPPADLVGVTGSVTNSLRPRASLRASERDRGATRRSPRRSSGAGA